MDNLLNDMQKKKNLTLPILALLFDLLPVALIYLNSLNIDIFYVYSSYILLTLLVCPILGLSLGVCALKQGKHIIGLLGKVIAIIAIALPLLLVGFIIIFFIGVTTGVISLM